VKSALAGSRRLCDQCGFGKLAGGRHIARLEYGERVTERSALEIFFPVGRREPAGRLEKLTRRPRTFQRRRKRAFVASALLPPEAWPSPASCI
jgi:hypothetical protein